MYAKLFREVVQGATLDIVATEHAADIPSGALKRSSEGVVGELIMTDWEKLAAGPGTIGQLVARFVGTEKVYKPNKTRKSRKAKR